MEALRDQTEEHLIARVGEGDGAAFEELFDRHRGAVHSVCNRVLGPAEAEDAAQQTFLSAYVAIARQGKRPRRLRRWLRSIAYNESVSHLRRRRVSAPIPHEVVDRGSDADGEALRQAELRGVIDDVRRLPEDQRAALVGSELEAKTHREIAEDLECRPGKVKALVFQARETLSGLRAARDVPCERVREQVARARVGRPPAGLTRHLQTCPGCAEFAREARQERRRVIALFPVGAALEWVRSLFAAGGSAAQAATAAGGGGAALAKVGIVVIVGGAAAGVGAGGVGDGVKDEQPERAAPGPAEHGPVEGAFESARADGRAVPVLRRDPSSGRADLGRPSRDALGRGREAEGGADPRPPSGAGPQATGAGAATTPGPPAKAHGPPAARPTQGKPVGRPPQAGGRPAGTATAAGNTPGIDPVPADLKPSADCPLQAPEHAAVC